MSQWFQAIEDGNIDYIEQNMGRMIYSRNEDDFTGLMLASCYISPKHAKIVQLLSQKEQKIQNNQQITALMLASIVDNVDVLPYLHQEFGLKDENNYTAYIWAHLAKSTKSDKYLKYEAACVEVDIYDKNFIKNIQLNANLKQTIDSLKQLSKVDIQQQNRQEQLKIKQNNLQNSQIVQFVKKHKHDLYFNDYNFQTTAQQFEQQFTINDLQSINDTVQFTQQQFYRFLQIEKQIQYYLSYFYNNLDQVEKITVNDCQIYTALQNKYGGFITTLLQ